MWLHALSPLHVGTGRGVGFIDLPIIREKATNYPIVPGSTLKGVTRSHWMETSGKTGNFRLAFGRQDAEAANAGALVFSDARLVCLPVRSLFGTFTYATCPLVLERLRRDLSSLGDESKLPVTTNPAPVSGSVNVVPNSALLHDDCIYIEELDFPATQSDTVTAWAEFLGTNVFPTDADWRARFKERLAVVPDDVFSFLCEMGTEVTARIRIDEGSKIVKEGALWYEEALPAETILASVVWCDQLRSAAGNGVKTKNALLDEFCPVDPVIIQVGGKGTTGKGRVSCSFGRGT